MKVIVPNYHKNKNKNNNNKGNDDNNHAMDIDGKEGLETIKIWARTDTRQPTNNAGGSGWIGACVVEVVTTMLDNIPNMKLVSKDKNRKVSNLKEVSFSSAEEFGNFFEVDADKPKKQSSKLNMIFTIESSMGWEDIVNKTNLIEVLKETNYEVFETEFESASIIPIGILAKQSPRTIIAGEKKKELINKLYAATKKNIPFELNVRNFVHYYPPTDSKIRVRDAVEITCERHHRKYFEQAFTDGTIIFRSQASSSDTIAQYEAQLNSHIKYMKNLYIYPFQGIDKPTMNSRIEINEKKMTLESYLLNDVKAKDGTPLFDKIEETILTSTTGKYFFYSTYDKTDEVFTFMHNEFPTLYGNTELYNPRKNVLGMPLGPVIKQAPTPLQKGFIGREICISDENRDAIIAKEAWSPPPPPPPRRRIGTATYASIVKGRSNDSEQGSNSGYNNRNNRYNDGYGNGEKLNGIGYGRSSNGVNHQGFKTRTAGGISTIGMDGDDDTIETKHTKGTDQDAATAITTATQQDKLMADLAMMITQMQKDTNDKLLNAQSESDRKMQKTQSDSDRKMTELTKSLTTAVKEIKETAIETQRRQTILEHSINAHNNQISALQECFQRVQAQVQNINEQVNHQDQLSETSESAHHQHVNAATQQMYNSIGGTTTSENDEGFITHKYKGKRGRQPKSPEKTSLRKSNENTPSKQPEKMARTMSDEENDDTRDQSMNSFTVLQNFSDDDDDNVDEPNDASQQKKHEDDNEKRTEAGHDARGAAKKK